MHRRFHCLRTILFIFIIGITTLFSTASIAFNNFLTPPNKVVELLKSGGYVIYFRHGSTIHTQLDNDFSDLQNCDFQRNLSKKGVAQSKATAIAIKKLNINIGDIYASPFCRTKDTAELIFKRYKVIYNLRASYATDSEETELLASTLKKLLSTIPKKDSNTVIVGHTTNLNIITKVRSRPEGVAHIFKPLGNNTYEHIGRITPKQWVALANKKEDVAELPANLETTSLK